MSTPNFLPPEYLEQLAAAGDSKEFAAGDVIFEQSEPGSSMFIIEEGNVRLIFDYGRRGKILGQGAYFGELALLSGSQDRTAAAVAGAEGCRLRVIDQPVFHALLQSDPTLVAALMRRTCSYLVESEQRLISDLQLRNRELEQTLDYLRRTREELNSAELLSQTDELTSLYNRRFLDAQVERLRTLPDPKGLALVLIDLDEFKCINDTHGHAVGDLVLKRVGDTLKIAVRNTDLPVRIGGDEFALLFVGITPEVAQRRARGILELLRALEITLPRATFNVSASIGGTIHRQGETWEQLLERADQSLYAAKAAGRNRINWDPG